MEEARGDSLDLEQLSNELEQERQMRDMLDFSATDLRNTVSQLEKRFDSIEDEGNEWKTRYETQQELNLQLERQIRMLEEKKEYIRGNPTDRLSSVRSYEEMPVGLLKQLVKQLEKEKKSLENQLKNYEWRIEQEAKAYHKANDERRTYLTEIAQTNLSIETAKKQKEKWSREKNILKEKYNVPTAERILDLKKGPIKKTVALKRLPKLKH
ncbi:coiled-coil domain containing 169 isoform X1 [Chiloscyllium plagiosum]|uniref:coiled-coil domain containing 169 isoform X1 n=2 Tax=Chiloscyllium plagiosum TaxID=36176 RepID=UPI001CB8387E|nr:coiled-coil domain containing 169 isoform X1 [Chiloscyllium plagiosum]